MLIVLRDGPHLELGRTQAGVHTEIPVSALSQIPGLRCLQLVAKVKARVEAVGKVPRSWRWPRLSESPGRPWPASLRSALPVSAHSRHSACGLGQ